ncbi:hypothetical protein DYB32_010308, partial [Aphanomyces invadans]
MVRIATIAAFATSASATISQSTFRALETHGVVDVLVTYKAGLGLTTLNTESLPRKARAQQVFNTLTNENIAITESAVEVARAAGVKHTQFWIDSVVAVEGANEELVTKLGALPNVVSVSPVEEYEAPTFDVDIVATNEWGLEKIGVPAAWARGNKGKGIV